MTNLDKTIIQALRAATRVVILTGAGVSAESGIPTFRDKQTGLWENFDAAELATPYAFERDPASVPYNDRAADAARCEGICRLKYTEESIP